MTHKLRLGTSIAAIAAAFSLTMSAPAFAHENENEDYESYEDSSHQQESDDIYAVLTPTHERAPDRVARPHSPGRPGGHHGPGYPPPPPGYGPGYPPGYGPDYPPPGWGPGHGAGRHHRGVQCRAVNRRGIAFYGQGRNMPEARDSAMRRCYNVSRTCYMDGCQPL